MSLHTRKQCVYDREKQIDIHLFVPIMLNFMLNRRTKVCEVLLHVTLRSELKDYDVT
jgi:hypothetical protein